MDAPRSRQELIAMLKVAIHNMEIINDHLRRICPLPADNDTQGG